MTSLAYTCQLNSCYLTYSSIRSYEKHLQRDHSDVLSWYSHHNEKDVDRDREIGVPVDISLDNLPKIENNFSEPNYQLILFKHCLKFLFYLFIFILISIFILLTRRKATEALYIG